LNTNIKAVFFDIGGTLVEKSKNKERDAGVIREMMRLVGLNCTLQEFVDGICRGEVRYREWRDLSLAELSIKEKWTRFLLPDIDSELIGQLATRLQQLWSSSKGSKRVRAYVPSVLQEINDRGYTLGTISHSSPMYLDEPGLSDLFEVKIHAPEFGRRKPHPALFIDAARRCGLQPHQCAYVGDNPWRDVVGPREAGYELVVLLRNGGGDRGPGAEMMQPDLVISDLRELLEYLPRRVGRNAGKVETAAGKVMYDAAVSTMWWEKTACGAEEFFNLGRELGFARFELNHQVPPDVFDAIDISRFSIGSLHDPCPAVIPAKVLEQTDVQITSLDEKLRRQGVEVVKRTIDQTIRMRARLVVVHPGRVAGDHSMDDRLRVLYRAGKRNCTEYEILKQELINDRATRAQPHLERGIESLREIISFAEGSGVMIGLENRFHYYELPVYNEMESILEEFTQPWVGWQFDVGHLQVHAQLGLMEFDVWLNKFSKRIVGVHLHDVIGIRDHQAPGSGEVDFFRIAGYLPRDCYRTLEIDNSTPRDDMASGLAHLAQCGCVYTL